MQTASNSLDCSQSTEESFYKPFTVNGCILPGNIFLAPLAGYSDAAFRSICTGFGASLTFTEMISAEALVRGNSRTYTLLDRADNESHIGVQLFASNPRSAANAARVVSKIHPHPSVIDINCGCSVPKIVKTGAGAALLRQPLMISDILSAVRDVTTIPISIKIRSGWDQKSLNYLEVAIYAQKIGVTMITLHPRTATQGFSGNAQWHHIKELKKNTDVPVIGSGDLLSVEEIKRMFAETGCNGIMLARGAIGNPFIFQRARLFLKQGILFPEPKAEEKLATALRQLEMASAKKGEYTASKEMRKHFCAYARGLPGSAKLRAHIVRAQCYRDFEDLVAHYLQAY